MNTTLTNRRGRRRWRAATACGWLLAAVAAGPAAAAERAADYLDADLRAAVEQLKRDVRAGTPVADVGALYQRAYVLYRWAGAFRRADPQANDIPWGLPSSVASISRARYLRADEELRPPLEAGARTVADYVLQLSLRDENPAALGNARLANPGPWTVTENATVDVVYTVGSEGLAAGANFVLNAHNASGLRLQADDPAARDYVTATASRAGVRVEAAPVEPAARGAVREADEEDAVPARQRITQFFVRGGRLEPGDTVTFRLGDTRGGGPGLVMQTFSNDFIPLELHLQFADGGTRYTLPRLGLQARGGAVAGVHGFAPSVVRTGERFELAIRADDVYANRASGPIPGWRVLLDGTPFREIAAGSEGIVVVDGLSFDRPGVHRFGIESLDGRFRGTVNPVLVQAAPQDRVYWGETHGHSGMAEGQGTSDAFFAFGRDDARLDFLVHSEHDIWMDDWEWEELRANVQENMSPGRFVPFLGYEWTVDQSFGGHHNVVFRTPQARSRVPQQTHPTLALLYQGLRRDNAPEDVLVIPHAHQAGDWRISDPTMETLAEIQSNHGNFEWFGHMYLRHGHHVGFVSGSDDHRSHPGYGVTRGRRFGLAAVLAPEKTADALFGAMKSLRTYATSGERMILDFSVNGTGMGRYAPQAPVREIRGEVIGTSAIDRIVVLKNSRELFAKDFRTRTGAIAGEERIELNVESASAPPDDIRDNPRSARAWNGTIEVRGAKIDGIEAPSYIDVLTQSAAVDAGDTGVVRFRTWTRGNHSSLILRLSGASAATTVRVHVEPYVERPGNLTRYRGVVRIPAFDAAFTLADAADAPARRTQPVEGYDDAVELRRVVDQAPLEQRFEFRDDAAPREGDYYTVRIVQENDQHAWGSPVWVGGYPPRRG
jgi:hypothetical protein